MERLTHKRENGIKRGYWSPNKKQELVDRLAMYEDREESADFGKWIPCSERLPKDRQIVVADIECSIEDRMCIFAYFKIVDHMECWINANTGFVFWLMLFNGRHCRNHTRRNNEDNNIHHYRLHALCCLELMHCRSKCR